MKILILGQTPPPFHGQAIMQKYLVDANWNWCEKKHIKLDYSGSSQEVGKFTLSKIIKLLTIILRVWLEYSKKKIDILYYPPAGPNKIPFYRDIVTLFFIRWCTDKIIFHFHSGGFDLLYNKLSLFEKFLARKIYKKPNAAIVLLDSFQNEIKWIKPLKIYSIANGVEDHYQNKNNFYNSGKIKILSVGLLSESKGIFIAFDAAKALKEKKYDFEWNFLGNWESEKIKREASNKLSAYGLNKNINFLGPIEGNTKWKFYNEAEIFCFPTFENEAMPLVILEAMMMSLPIVSTNWRGIANMIDNEKNGILVKIKNPLELFEAMVKLILNKNLRNELGRNAREKYLNQFTINKHLQEIEKVFKEIGNVGEDFNSA